MFVLIVALIILWLIIFGDSGTPTSQPKSYTSSTSSSNSNSPDTGYAKEAIQFIDGYLHLCKNRSVDAICTLFHIDNDNYFNDYKTEMKCFIYRIDDEKAADELIPFQRVWTKLKMEKFDAFMNGEPGVTISNYSDDADNYVKEYFGCEDLHWVYTDVDEYVFTENDRAIIKLERTLFNKGNSSVWMATLNYIKQETLKKWPNATISIGPGGITVKS